MAFEQPGFSWTRTAGENLTARQFCGVDIERNTGQVIKPSAGGRVVAFLQNHPNDGESATLVSDGITKCQVGATGIESGDDVSVNANGQVVQAVSGNRAVGIALETTPANAIGTILLRLGSSTVAGS